MTIPVIDWPTDAWRVGSENWRLEGQTIQTPGLFGPGTVIHVENRVWRVTVDLSPLTEAEFRKVRAVLDEVRGRYAVIHVPVQSSAAFDEGAGDPLTWDGGITWDGGVLFDGEPTTGITITADAPAGATRIKVSTSVINQGAMFALPGNRVHRVYGYDGGDLVINPPLRAAVTAGDAVELAAPVARMRLDTDSAAIVRGMANISRPAQIELIEAL
jgi:hypothetical protein